MSLRVWFLVIRLGAILHMKTLRPHVSTCDPHRQVCAAQRPRPSRKTTTTRTASSSRRPHEAIGSANSQSPLCLAAAAKKASFCHGSLLLLSTESRAAWRPGLSHADCLWDELPVGTGPKMVSQWSLYDRKTESTWEKWLGWIAAWSDWVLAAEATKAERASEATCLTPRPPSLIVREAWSHCVSVRSQLVMRHNAVRNNSSKVARPALSTDYCYYYYYYYYACVCLQYFLPFFSIVLFRFIWSNMNEWINNYKYMDTLPGARDAQKQQIVALVNGDIAGSHQVGNSKKIVI